MRSILDILPVWRSNPGGDFTSVADSPKLFEFVSEIRDRGERWVFPFETAQDVVAVLRTQLAYLFGDALKLRMRASESGVTGNKFKSIGARELRLVIEQPRGWEYLLLSEALRREIDASLDLRRDWTVNVALGGGMLVKPSELVRWIQEKNSEASRIFGNVNRLFERALQEALGPPGQPGDAEVIIYVANRVGEAYRAALQWKLDFARVSVDEQLRNLVELSSTLCDNTVTQVEEFVERLSNTMEEVFSAPPDDSQKVISLNLVLTVPEQTALTEELSRLTTLIESGEIEWR